MKKTTAGFDKFMNKKSNAAIKEGFKQQKRKIKKELKEQKAQRYKQRNEGFGNNRFSDNSTQQKPERSFQKNNDSNEKPERSFKKKFEEDKPSFKKSKSVPFKRDNQSNEKPERFFKKRTDDNRPSLNKSKSAFNKENTSYQRPGKPLKKRFDENRTSSFKKPKTSSFNKENINQPQPAHEVMPLNKYVAHAGICGRREAAEMVKEGKVKVNNEVLTEPGYKVKAEDKIAVNGKLIFAQKNLVYILLNKPKDYITTTSDPEGRKTIFELLKNATDDRVFPVGRLDRNTTGVLLLTNDGELTQKLTHPSFRIKKIYEVRLDKPLAKKDMEAVAQGFELDDGFIAADTISYADANDKSIVGIEIHSGRNRIVRRIFEHLGYDVKNLDRVLFANLTKKNVERGKWRLLKEKEVRLLKYMNQSFLKKDEQHTENPKLLTTTKRAAVKRTRPEKK